MAVYQDKARERIKKSLPKIKRLVEKGKAEEYKEADTRKIVNLALECLGWDSFENITAEQMINSRYADYVVKTDDEQIYVVEVKQIGLKLKDSHLNQARQYAVDEGIDWIILTNGDDWQVYRTTMEGKIPVTKLVFKLTITSDEMKPAQKTELLYLLSEEANRKKEIEDYYDKRVALSAENIADHLLGDDVINKLRLSLRASTGQRLANSEIAKAMVTRLFREDKVTEEHHKMIRKMERAEKK